MDDESRRVGTGRDGPGASTAPGVTVAIIDAYVSPTLYSDAVEYAKRNQGSTSRVHGRGSQQWQPGQFKEMIQRPFTKTEECEASGWSGEQTLDVEAVHAMAPGAKVLYVGGKNCTVSLYNAVEEVVDGHLANIVTDSWTNGPEEEEGETTESREAFNHVLLMAAGTGVGVQFSSGDEGDNFIVSGSQQPSFPGTSPYATAVGGTSVEIGAQNNRLGEVGWSTGISALCTEELADTRRCAKPPKSASGSRKHPVNTTTAVAAEPPTSTPSPGTRNRWCPRKSPRGPGRAS